MTNIIDEIKNWSPGVLSNKQINTLIRRDVLHGIEEDSKDIGLSSFDLHITSEAYELQQGCIRPSAKSFSDQVLKNKLLAMPYEPDQSGEYHLNKQSTYVFKLKESFKFAGGANHPLRDVLFGTATGRSSIGRVDVLVRLIAEGSNLYDSFEGKGAGDLYLEVIPITFHVIVKEGTALSQLRLFYGQQEMSRLTDEEVAFRGMLTNSDAKCDSLGVDLTPSQLSSLISTPGLRAKDTEVALKLWLEDHYKPDIFWDPIESAPSKEEQRIVLKQNEFYILRSRELISLPNDVAVYCRAMDESLGEMRIHYAGFVHPHFGSNRKDGKPGTPLIFEVRGHNMNIVLRDKETLANLQFYRMSMPADPPKVKDPNNDYQDQDLKLSKLFKEWD